MRAFAERKLAKIGRLRHDSTRVELKLSVEKNPSVAAHEIAAVWLRGRTLRAREASRDMKASIEEVAEKWHRELSDARASQRTASRLSVRPSLSEFACAPDHTASRPFRHVRGKEMTAPIPSSEAPSITPRNGRAGVCRHVEQQLGQRATALLPRSGAGVRRLVVPPRRLSARPGNGRAVVHRCARARSGARRVRAAR
jgi:ribosomal subunit interface protein